MPYIEGRKTYHGYMSPPPGDYLDDQDKTILARVYGKCREKYTGEYHLNKAKCAKIAWSVVKKRRR